MIPIRSILLLVATFNLIEAGSDGVISLPELTDKLEQVTEHVEELLMAVIHNEKVLKVKILEAIHDFELLKIDDEEDRALTNKLLDVLKSYLPQALTSVPPTQSSVSSQASNECTDLTNKLNLLKEVLLAFVNAVNHNDFAAELATAVNHIKDLQFDTPLDGESYQQLVNGLADLQQILDLISEQEHQVDDLKDIQTEIDTMKQHVKKICSLSGINIDGKLVGGRDTFEDLFDGLKTHLKMAAFWIYFLEQQKSSYIYYCSNSRGILPNRYYQFVEISA